MPHWPLAGTHRYLLQAVPPEAPQIFAAVHFWVCDCKRSVLHTLFPQLSLVLAQESHAPEPLQEPFWPQLFFPSTAHWSCGSMLALALPHSPSRPADFKLAAHAWQSPVQPELQQTPSTQLPVAHAAHAPDTLQSLARLHNAPCTFLVRQAPDVLQYCPLGQLASLAQPLGQLAIRPSHRAPPEQIGAPAAPDFAGPQVPFKFADCLSPAEQASHAPPHVVSQHTPSTQLPVTHSAQVPAVLQSLVRLHAAPCVFFAAQVPPDAQYVPLGQPLSLKQDAGQLALEPSHTTAPEHTGEPDSPGFVTPHTPLEMPDSLSAAEHASHAPAQAVLQQKPSAQNPVAHWLDAVHADETTSFATH